MKLEKDTWYWMSHPQEGDIFYPVFAKDENHVLLDGKLCENKEIEELIFTKAIMPDDMGE